MTHLRYPSFIQRTTRGGTRAFLAGVISGLVALSWTGVFPLLGNHPAYGAVSMYEAITVPNGSKTITIQVSDAPVREVLRALAKEGGLNLMLDESVTGTITLDLKKTPLNEALTAIASLSNLTIIPQSQNLFLVLHRDRAQSVGLNRPLTHIIPIQFGNASQMAALLNSSLLADPAMQQGVGGQAGAQGGGQAGGQGALQGGANLKVQADPRTNSIMVIGTTRDIELAEAAVKSLDRPRESKIFYLSHANAVDVATQLVSSIFNDGTQGLLISGAGGGGGQGGGQGGGRNSGGGGLGAGGQGGVLQTQASSLRVNTEAITEGSGINNITGGGSGGNGSSSFSSDILLRGIIKSSSTIQVSPLSAIVLPDTRLNSLTILGTSEQIAQAEALIPVLDAEPPQVSIDVSLVEISEQGVKQLSTNVGLADGRFQFGFNNEALSGIRSQTAVPTTAGTGIIGLPTNDPTDARSTARSGMLFSSRPLVTGNDYLFQVNALINNRRAKVLANPTIVATHDTEAIVSIVDQIVRRVNVTVAGLAGTTTITTELGEAGIVLDILPKIGEDGTVTMRIRPSITSIRDIQQDSNGNQVTLLTKRDLLAQAVRVKDGQTLIIGGLVKENSSLTKDKYPLLGDLPIVGAMFRASASSTNRSELVLMMTPHILNPLNQTPTITRSPMNVSILEGLAP
ncbi:MAG: secretin N-terminal domain-containing protein [Vampirovibrionales bacterium]|nr:secretin N-terminal domain-containing protein [Vampirovibrionales bacterium]